MEPNTFQHDNPLTESSHNDGYVPYEPRYMSSYLDGIEDIENYVPDGLLPIAVGDSFLEGRYTVLQKLGYGGSSTVWLARDRDTEHGLLVTLKAVRADRSGSNTTGLAILQHLKSLYPLSNHFQTVLHHFYEQSPNGSHLVMVCPLAGPSVAALYSLPTNHHSTEKPVGTRRFRADLAKRIATDTANGLYQMHSAGIVHGDLTPSNILFRIAPKVAKWSDAEVIAHLGEPKRDKVRMITGVELLRKGRGRLFTSSDDASHGPHAPPFVYRSVPISKIGNATLLQESTFINDFGQSYFAASPPADYQPGTILNYMSPEMFFENRAGLESDVWSLACLIYEIRTGLPLFNMVWSLNDDNLVMRHAELLGGRLPAPWLDALDPESREQWFTDDGELMTVDEQRCFMETLEEGGSFPIGRPQSLRERLRLAGKNNPPEADEEPVCGRPGVSKDEFLIGQTQSLHEKLHLTGKNNPSDADEAPMYENPDVAIEDHEVELLADLLSKMLKYQPEERITIVEVIKHPWFTGSKTPAGRAGNQKLDDPHGTQRAGKVIK